MARFTQRLGLTRYEADEHYKLALDAFRKGRFDVAIDNMSKAIEALPNYAEYYATRGYFFLEDGVTQKALEDFEQALKLNRYEMLAHYGRGIIAYKDRNWNEALAHFTDAYKCDPKRPETQYYLALVMHHQHDNQSALRVMQGALAAFEAADDRRRNEAARWVKELQRLVENVKDKPQLPAVPPLVIQPPERK